MPQGPNGLRARAPTIVPSFSKEERAELPHERCSSIGLEEGEGPVVVWGRFPPPSALAALRSTGIPRAPAT